MSVAVWKLCEGLGGLQRVLSTNEMFQFISVDTVPCRYEEQKPIYRYRAVLLNVYCEK